MVGHYSHTLLLDMPVEVHHLAIALYSATLCSDLTKQEPSYVRWTPLCATRGTHESMLGCGLRLVTTVTSYTRTYKRLEEVSKLS
jgi:hypothetical protein